MSIETEMMQTIHKNNQCIKLLDLAIEENVLMNERVFYVQVDSSNVVANINVRLQVIKALKEAIYTNFPEFKEST